VVNPFLHLMMHLTSRSRFPSAAAGHTRAVHAADAEYESEHEAQHAMMDCLGEMIWQAQRNKTAPDAAVYLGCLESSE